MCVMEHPGFLADLDAKRRKLETLERFHLTGLVLSMS